MSNMLYTNGLKFIVFRVPAEIAGNSEDMLSQLRNFLSRSSSSHTKKKADWETLREKIVSGPCRVRVSVRMKNYRSVNYDGRHCFIIAVSRSYVRDDRGNEF